MNEGIKTFSTKIDSRIEDQIKTNEEIKKLLEEGYVIDIQITNESTKMTIIKE